MNTEELRQLVAIANQLLAVSDPIVKTVRDVGALVKPLLQDAAIAFADIREDTVNHYTARGFTREEAITMTLADMAAVRDALKNRKKT